MTLSGGGVGTPILETARLRIERFTFKDAGFILRLLNEPSFILNIADKGVRTLDDARAHLASGPLAHYQRHGFGLWRVSERATGTPVGMCGLIQREALPDVDLGYALLPEFTGKGSVRLNIAIGDGCVIAADTVVTRDCLPHGLYSDLPARRVRELPAFAKGRPAPSRPTTGALVGCSPSIAGIE